jgi:hypothetical protein
MLHKTTKRILYLTFGFMLLLAWQFQPTRSFGPLCKAVLQTQTVQLFPGPM